MQVDLADRRQLGGEVDDPFAGKLAPVMSSK
jgi:hypothetical protein